MSSDPITTRLMRAVRRRGVAAVARDAGRRVGRMVYSERRLLIYRTPVEAVAHLPARLEPGWSLRIEASSLQEGRQFRDADRHTVTVLQSYLVPELGGEELLLAFIDNRLAAFNIVAVRTAPRWPLTETKSELPLAETDAVFVSGFVVPEFRGRHLFRVMYGASADNAAARGASAMWTWCEHWNDPSRKTIEAVGFRYVGSHARRTIAGIGGPLVRTIADARHPC